ncbi:hypothetical protein CLU79DRAFT_769201, partial [Phycomyces nitens]
MKSPKKKRIYQYLIISEFNNMVQPQYSIPHGVCLSVCLNSPLSFGQRDNQAGYRKDSQLDDSLSNCQYHCRYLFRKYYRILVLPINTYIMKLSCLVYYRYTCMINCCVFWNLHTDLRSMIYCNTGSLVTNLYIYIYIYIYIGFLI